MNHNPLSGTGKVFRFSLKQMMGAKGWLISTFLIAALLLIGIPLVLWASSAASVKDKSEDDGSPRIKNVFVCDQTEGEADYNVFKQDTTSEFADANYQLFDSMDKAKSAVTDNSSTIILQVTKPDSRYLLNAILPEETQLSRSKASSFVSYVQSNFTAITMQKAKLTPEGINLLNLPVTAETTGLSSDAAEDKAEKSTTEKILGLLIPFLIIMLMYMMVMLYGQSVANSVMLEKNSKLIESVLVAVNPVALMTGKLFAGAAAAVIQLLIWLGSLFGGVLGGAAFALKMVPETTSGTVKTVTAFMESGLPVSVSGILLGVLVIALGLLLYLSLSCLSGALASKQEDLNKTNVVFVLVLVASFILCLPDFSSAASESVSGVSDAAWLRIFPFTAILTVPGDLVLGKLSVGMTIGCFAAMLAALALFVLLAATVYRMLVFYRGALPTPKTLLTMFRDSRKTGKE